ncbi:hypothetical protein F4780DRAFT_774905 [Xylariomycetidae sp. FL0641]|nr:hypothetical protein F4780DRAFT_774905 [Xylariomycetidae sp. FL0641]
MALASTDMPGPPASSGPGSRIPGTPSAGNDTTGADAAPAAVDSPASPSSSDVLARFEFEAGRGNEGSKVLMVEWTPGAAEGHEGWELTWEGKSRTATFALAERDGAARRVYFLLPSDAPVPAAVALTHAPTGRALATKALPAIFPSELLRAGDHAGTGARGVLHTRWAAARRAQLEAEIRRERSANAESVGLEMALQERQWICEHFGLDDPDAADYNGATAAGTAGARGGRPAQQQHQQQQQQPPPTPQSPRSPVGGRLGEKLRGLKLSTSPAELTSHSVPNSAQPQHADDAPRRSVMPVPAPAPGAGVASLDAMMGGGGGAPQSAAPVMAQSKDTEDELFALPMSPRSPEMKTSPFSFLK